MKSSPFTNAHSHIFTAKHAPDYFLKTAIKSTGLAIWIDTLLQKPATRDIIKGLGKILYWSSPEKREVAERYIQFVQIGTSSTQKDVYEKIANTYRKFGDYRIVVLSQVLDYLDLERTSNHKNIQTQVEEIVELKRCAGYQNNLIPFLGIDPRMTGIDLFEWVKKYISRDYGFAGIKIYPATGFFPFDTRLDEIWKWAEENQVPVMTHCTRVGSFYLGRMESIINSGGLNIPSLNPNHPMMDSIRLRINNVISDATIREKNVVWCNIFGHPENYIPVLDKYPKLKLCLAHLGGANEILLYNNQPNKRLQYPSYLQDNWYEHILKLIRKYDNVYSDISYTLSSKDAMDLIIAELRKDLKTPNTENKNLFNRILYGTDFYMTQREELGDEPDLQQIFLGKFTQAEASLLACTNTANYLDSTIWPKEE